MTVFYWMKSLGQFKAYSVAILPLFSIFIAFSAAGNGLKSSDTVAVYVLSDIHLNLNYSPTSTPEVFCMPTTESADTEYKFGQYGCDSPAALISSAVDQLNSLFQQNIGKYEDSVFIFLGDSTCCDPKSELETSAGILGGLSTSSDTLYATIGNNDCKQDYYQAYNASEWIHNVLIPSWSVFMPGGAALQSFNNSGSYSVNVRAGLRIISLNTVLLSRKHKPDEHNTLDDPNGIFSFLRSSLKDAEQNGDRVWIIGHIPPGVGTANGRTTWHEKYVSTYREIISDYGHVISLILNGHYHKDDFKLYFEDIPVILTPAVSPIFDNNPGMRVLYASISNNYTAFDTDVYYANLTRANSEGTIEWQKEYNWRQTYGGLTLSYADLVQVKDSIISCHQNGSSCADEYLQRRMVLSGVSNPNNHAMDISYVACSWTSLTEAEFDACLSAFSSSEENDNIIETILYVIYYAFIIFCVATAFIISCVAFSIFIGFDLYFFFQFTRGLAKGRDAHIDDSEYEQFISN